MSFPHLDRCSCGSPGAGSNKDGDKTRQVQPPPHLTTKKNDYRINPIKKRVVTSSNFSNENIKISSARSQPSLRDENFKNFISSNRSDVIKRSQKVKADDKESKKSSNHQETNGPIGACLEENDLKNNPEISIKESSKIRTQSSSAPRSSNASKPSMTNIDEILTPDIPSIIENETQAVVVRSTETSCSSEYTPLSYDVNYVKVSPPRLTRRPKKSDETTADSNNNNSSGIGSGPLSRAQQLGGSKQTSEQKQNLKKILRTPPETPPDDNKVSLKVDKKSNVASIRLGVSNAPLKSVSSKLPTNQKIASTSRNEEKEVLELTFTVLLEKGTLKKSNKSKAEEANSAVIKVKTDDVRLDADSKRFVAESITEAIRGNLSLLQVENTSESSVVETCEPRATKLNTGEVKLKKQNYNGILKSPMHDRNSLISKSFDCNESKDLSNHEVTTSYQSLDRKSAIQRDRKQLDRIKEAGSSPLDENSGKKYQSLNNFSPLHSRLTTSAIIHRPSGFGINNDFKKNRVTNFHSRYDSDVCDYDTKDNKMQRMFSKSSFNNNGNVFANNNNNNKVWMKNKYSTSHYYGSSKDNAEELTHMNWDDLMHEAKSLGIPLKRPDKMISDADKDVFKFSQNNITSRFLKHLIGKKAGLKLTKSICGGELGRTRDEYFSDLSSACYQCPYETKKNNSPLKERFRFMDLILGRSKSSKALNDDCPLCRQQQQSNFFSRSKNIIKRSMSTNRGINHKSTKNSKCPKDHCYDYSCTCYCTCKQGNGNKVLRSTSSPAPTSTKPNSCRKSGFNDRCYDGSRKETSTKKDKTMFDTFSLSDNYRSLLSPKKSAPRNYQPESSFCCHPYTPQNHHRQFKLLHLNSCGDDGDYDDENDNGDNRDDVFVDEIDVAAVGGLKKHAMVKREPSKSVGFDSPDTSATNQPSLQDKNISTSSSKVNPTNSIGFLRSLKLLKDKGWYWGNMSFEKAEEVLVEKVDGSFLVRDSSDDRFILSVSFRSQGKTHHTRIEHIQGVFSFYSQRTNCPGLSVITTSTDVTSSTSIVDFIEDAIKRSLQGENLYYLRESNDPGASPTPVRLLYPVLKPSLALKDSCVS